MKQIKLKKNCLKNNETSFIIQYLNNLGITKVDSFLKQPEETDELNPFLLKNMKEGVEVAHALLSKGCKVFVQVDSDTDGYTSSAILINYIHRRYPSATITWRLHNGKEHGIITNTVSSDTELVFVPDAGSNQFKEQKELCDKGMKVIVLDHHEVSEQELLETTPAIIINNQTSPQFPNKFLSGAGVVYKFIKALDKVYFSNNPIFHDYGDLAAVGIIADAMNMTSLDNNYIAYWGLSHIHNKFIQTLAIKQARGIKNPNKLTKIDVAFYIAPVLNGLIRIGTAEEKEMIFSAMINNEDDNLYPHTWRGVTKQETLWERAVRIAVNAKSKQDSQKKKSFEWLCKDIREKGLDQHNIIIVTLDEQDSSKVSANITGLIAMELVKEFNKPCLVLRTTTFNDIAVFGGSGRNGNFYNLPDLKLALNAAGGFYQEGHANAFGVFLKPDQVDNIRSYFDSHFNAQDFLDTVYEVDYWFHTGEDINSGMLLEIAEHEELWGNSIPQPKFAFDFNTNAAIVKIMGADNSSLKITSNGIDFVAFKRKDWIELLQQNPKAHISIVGRPQINEWMGRQRIQIIIEDIDIKEPEHIDLDSLI